MKGVSRGKISRLASAVSHILYVDDLLIAYLVDTKNAKNMKKVLNLYCARSGQEISKAKLKIFSPKN